MTPHVYIGYDAVEHDAVLTLESTLEAELWGYEGSGRGTRLVQEDLRARGLYTRPEVI